MPNSRANNPVASLTRLSPSRMSVMRLGRPMRWAMDVAASASVGATTAPSTRPIFQSNPGNNHGAPSATPITVKETSPKARSRMLTRL